MTCNTSGGLGGTVTPGPADSSYSSNWLFPREILYFTFTIVNHAAGGNHQSHTWQIQYFDSVSGATPTHTDTVVVPSGTTTIYTSYPMGADYRMNVLYRATSVPNSDTAQAGWEATCSSDLSGSTSLNPVITDITSVYANNP